MLELYSEWPFRAQELHHVLEVDIGSVNLDQGNEPTLLTLLASSLGIFTVEVSLSTVVFASGQVGLQITGQLSVRPGQASVRPT